MKVSSADGSAGAMMLKPSAAPPSNHAMIVSATCSGVPTNVKWPRPPPSRDSSSRTVSFSRTASSMIRSDLLCDAFEFRPRQDEIGQRRVELEHRRVDLEVPGQL